MSRKKTIVIGSVVGVGLLIGLACYFLLRGERPLIPANTIAACYIDCERAYKNFDDVSKMVGERLDGRLRRDFDSQLEDARKFCENQLVCYRPRWICCMLGIGPDLEKDVCITTVVRCETTAKDNRGRTLEEWIKSEWCEQEGYNDSYYKREHKASSSMVDGTPILALKTIDTWEEGREEYVELAIAFVDERYLIAVTCPNARDWQTTEDHIRGLIKLYRDGEGETSRSFADLADLPGSAIARVQTCNIGTAADIFGCRDTIDKICRACEDESLAEEICKVGDLTVDLMLDSSNFGTATSIEAGSEEIAKALEGVLNLGLFANRLGLDVALGSRELEDVDLGRNLRAVERDWRECTAELSDMSRRCRLHELKDLYRQQRKAVKVERDETEVSVTWEMETAKFLDCVVPFVVREIDRH